MIKAETFKAYLTGIASIDFEHWHLLKQLSRAYDAASHEEAQSRVDQFIAAWKLHHDHEDQLIQDINFPDAQSHMEGHLRLHEVYHRLRHDVLTDGYNLHSAKAYIDMVVQLILDHINQYDYQYSIWARHNCTQEQNERFGIGRPALI